MTLKEVAEEFGFSFCEKNEKFTWAIMTTRIDGKEIPWIFKAGKQIFYAGNTDNCNLWFHETRKDLTPERLIAFVEALNYCGLELELHDLVDPEDWQEIAGINDAFEDERYARNIMED